LKTSRAGLNKTSPKGKGGTGTTSILLETKEKEGISEPESSQREGIARVYGKNQVSKGPGSAPVQEKERTNYKIQTDFACVYRRTLRYGYQPGEKRRKIDVAILSRISISLRNGGRRNLRKKTVSKTGPRKTSILT